MKASKLRTVVAAVVFVVLSVGLIAGVGLGTLSGFGWDTIAMLCPVGALTSMIAAKTLIPRAIVSIVIAVVLVFLVGRAFCGWVCPVPVLSRLRSFFRSPAARKRAAERRHEEVSAIAKAELSCKSEGKSCGHDCSSCAAIRNGAQTKLDSRHVVLGGALLSTAVFGFPVFCLICPVGLTFATVLVFWRLFFNGDMTVSALLIPVVLIVELVFLRKWCSKFCPLSAFMSLVSRFGRTWLPTIDDSKCLETSKDTACSRCAEVCEADINLRHLAAGERGLADCTRCHACADACPAKAISFPLLAKRAQDTDAGGSSGERVGAKAAAAPAPTATTGAVGGETPPTAVTGEAPQPR